MHMSFKFDLVKRGCIKSKGTVIPNQFGDDNNPLFGYPLKIYGFIILKVERIS
jgi:hypothetical protein